MNTAETISLIALFIAAISALYARKSNKISKDALKISKREYEMKLSSFEIEIIDSLKIINGDKNILLFEVRINNKSTSKNSFSSYLELNFTDNNISALRIFHNPQIVVEKDIEIFANDILIDDKSSLIKWFIYEQPREIFKGKIESYNVNIADIDGNCISKKTYMIKTENL